jgi:hypothetical protein
MATLGWFALGVVLVLSLLVRGIVVAGATRTDFRRDEFSHERAARLAGTQAAWYSSRHAHAGNGHRAA